jgi:uncharacterized protein YyaL (SSP411 family)
MEESAVRLLIARGRSKLLEARRKRSTPAVDTTLYTAWNAMFVSAYLEAWRVLDRADCRDFALKSLERIVSEAWDEYRGFRHRLGEPKLEGMLDDQVFTVVAMLDAYEATLDRRWFDRAERAMRLALEKYSDPEGGGFFDRASDAPLLGGLDVRRKPLQDSPIPGANSVAAIALCRLYALSGDKLFSEQAERTLEAFAGVAPQFGLFAATYALAGLLIARHPLQVVVTGREGDQGADQLESAARSIYRFGMAILRVTPQRLSAGGLAPALEQTIPGLRADLPQALVCVGTTCHAPVTEPEDLKALLTTPAVGRAAG